MDDSRQIEFLDSTPRNSRLARAAEKVVRGSDRATPFGAP